MTSKKRIELDSLGTKKIDIERLWGAQTQRSYENFKIGKEKIPLEIIKALGQQKKAAAEANIEESLDSRWASIMLLTPGMFLLTQHVINSGVITLAFLSSRTSNSFEIISSLP